MRLSALTSTRTPATPLLDDLRANAVSYRHFRHAAEAGHAHAIFRPARYLSSLPEMPGSVRLDASAPLAAACPACLEQIPLSADDKRYYVHGSRTAKREGEPSGAFSQRASHSKEDSPAGAEKAAKSSRDYSGSREQMWGGGRRCSCATRRALAASALRLSAEAAGRRPYEHSGV